MPSRIPYDDDVVDGRDGRGPSAAGNSVEVVVGMVTVIVPSVGVSGAVAAAPAAAAAVQTSHVWVSRRGKPTI